MKLNGNNGNIYYRIIEAIQNQNLYSYVEENIKDKDDSEVEFIKEYSELKKFPIRLIDANEENVVHIKENQKLTPQLSPNIISFKFSDFGPNFNCFQYNELEQNRLLYSVSKVIFSYKSINNLLDLSKLKEFTNKIRDGYQENIQAVYHNVFTLFIILGFACC